mmetsp:Transcript_24800/g.58843  ORF Transcript_24800/g.58843 Transcript_24800/m.58843 type:complete len:217 (+) Transcript_24800:1352-2002(+)
MYRCVSFFISFVSDIASWSAIQSSASYCGVLGVFKSSTDEIFPARTSLRLLNIGDSTIVGAVVGDGSSVGVTGDSLLLTDEARAPPIPAATATTKIVKPTRIHLRRRPFGFPFTAGSIFCKSFVSSSWFLYCSTGVVPAGELFSKSVVTPSHEELATLDSTSIICSGVLLPTQDDTVTFPSTSTSWRFDITCVSTSSLSGGIDGCSVNEALTRFSA